MPSKDRNLPSIKFYNQDTVQRASPPHHSGIVLRCWHDAEDIPMPSTLLDPLSRPLNRGEVGVSFLSDAGRREIVQESELKLLDRTFQPGDFCKRHVEDHRSGVVKRVSVRGTVEHVISGEPVEGYKMQEDVRFRCDAEIGDYVVCDDWFGQVVELFDESIIELPTGQLVRLPEFSSRLIVGERAENIIPNPTNGSSVRNLFGLLLGNDRPSGLETVIEVKHTVYAVAWLALNQSLTLEEAQNRQRPQKFWHGKDISKLTLVRSHSDSQLRLSDRINLKDTTGLPYTTHGREGEACGVVTVQSYLMSSTETTIDVLWQDGVEETVKSIDVIPYLNPDEYDTWPGDHVLWSSEGVKRPAVVQAVDAAQRTATLLFNDTGKVEMVSLLELDPHGTSDADPMAQLNFEGLGVRRGDFVFIHQEGTTNGFEKPRVPRIGELEAWVRENPFVSGQLHGWRKEMSELGAQIATSRSAEGDLQVHMKEPDSSLHWVGEVVDLLLDGTIKVVHPDETVKTYPLERLTKLYDGIDQLEDDLYEPSEADSHGSASYDAYIEEEGWAVTEHGEWQPQDYYRHHDELVEEGDHFAIYDDEGYPVILLPEPESELPPPAEPQSVGGTPPPPSEDVIVESPDIPTAPLTSDTLEDISDVNGNHEDEEEDDSPWKRFDILPSAPPDHAYYSTTPSQPSKSFHARLAREYRILQSSLPDSIIVRAFEDRSDLLRCLIIGPSNTPYEDAPFVIDWMLDSNFPNTPPLAHFLSWTNGNGRGANLYEEGKVCLSILGTWAGDRNETWSASRSSLLQAFVSIQGLVLVKEPWFCEPAYEKLRGTEEGIVNSRLYSEKAYVLSRGFVRRSLEIPLGGLEKEIEWMYYTNGRLEKVLRDSRTLIEKSRAQEDTEDQDLAVPRLTVGGIIALERTLSKLQGLLDARV
ncbi:isocitrate lyase [Moniliophthora roreri MCA 2997]|uniref:Isocitrate lyase n=1 Tax=Moniliophthora roreri (strain MCA 2997) TaxID=1381753 RepID=V2Z251_MONRO|nr:isocitrate lyase [Moniliophthora roreri MCA 2997]